MSDFLLYSTSGCHLCELALQIALPLLALRGEELIEVEIADDEALLQRYGTTIPVIKRLADDAELGWPFDSEQLQDWLGSV